MSCVETTVARKEYHVSHSAGVGSLALIALTTSGIGVKPYPSDTPGGNLVQSLHTSKCLSYLPPSHLIPFLKTVPPKIKIQGLTTVPIFPSCGSLFSTIPSRNTLPSLPQGHQRTISLD